MIICSYLWLKGRIMRKNCIFFTPLCLFLSPMTLGAIESVKVINDTSSSIYVHKGGYAPSQRIQPGKWKRFSYPFELTLPNSQQKIYSNLLVASAGGRWETTANGFTYLQKPRLLACLDYGLPEKKHTTGKRTWTISSSEGKEPNCYVKGFRQLWWQPAY